MKWFKHDADANMDARLQEILLDYGLEGYGLYWYCIELITHKLDSDNITFELEHDARLIARNTGNSVQKVQEMMTRFVDIGLFENLDGTITCLKLAKRLDKSMTNSPKMREFIQNVRERHDTVRNCQPRIEEEVEVDKKKIIKKSPSKNIELDWHDIQLTDQQKQYIIQIRKDCKKKLTQLALNPILKELDIAKMNGIDYQESIDIWAMRGWVAFKADWAMNHKGQNNGKSFSNTATLTNLGDTNF